MLDGGTRLSRIPLNDETAWSGSPASEARAGLVSAATAAGHLRRARAALDENDPRGAADELAALQVPYSQAFLPFATLVVATDAAEHAAYARELDLGRAVHTVQTGGIVVTSFVSAMHGVLVHRIEGAHDVTVALETPHEVLGRRADAHGATLRLRLPEDVAPTHEPEAVPVTWPTAPGRSLEGAVVVGVGSEAGATLIVVATGTTFTAAGAAPVGDADAVEARARARVDDALAVGWEKLLEAHEADVAPRLARASMDLGDEPRDADGRALMTDTRLARAEAHPDGPLVADPALAGLLFDYGRYLLLASSRPGGLPPTLQGIWNDEMQPPWSSNYTVNINAQMNMWAALPTALDECTEPFFDFIAALADAGTATAARLYGVRGWVAHHNSDAWLLTSPVGAGHGDARWTAWPFAGPWLITHIREAIAFGAIDVTRLRMLWPAVRGAAAFVLDWVGQDADGSWVTAPATSPENAYVLEDGREAAIDTTTTMDLTLARAALATLDVVAAALGSEDDDDVVIDARALRDRLPREPAIESEGRIREWSRDRTSTDPHHRHVSHLVGLYPGSDPWTPRAREAAEASLIARGDESSGWSLVWKGLLWARLGRGERVADFIRLLLRDAESLSGPFAGGLYPNLFAAHPPFQIDANLGFPALLAEAILQSHDGLHLLPALPAALASGSARGLIARPGVVVDVEWRAGALVEARLRRRDDAPGVLPMRVRWRDAVASVTLEDEQVAHITAQDFAPSSTDAGA